MSAVATSTSQVDVTRAQLEDFLYEEAALLDAWKLTEWFTLFAPGARYLVPPAGSDDDVDPATTLFYVADDYHRLGERVKRLGKRTAHVEFPHSRCRRIVTNVRLLGGTNDDFRATSNFVTYRSKRNVTETYLGHHLYRLCVRGGTIRILEKRSFLDTDDIYTQGKVSIIL
jgi:p-cumate 2,3-dioxygenase beta subunit